VGDGYFQGVAFVACAAQIDVFRNELLIGVPKQRAGQQVGFTEDLESVANAEYFTAFGGEAGNALHDGAKAGDGAAAEIVAIGKSAGKDDAVFFAKAAQVRILMPKHGHFLAEVVGQGVLHVSIAIGTRENDNSKSHGRMF
jgi:hypothetical protein